MKLIMLGAPGAGKGTVCKKILETDKVAHISTGDILRAAVKDGTELGKKAQEFMNAGALVPDELIMGIMGERLKEPDCASGYLLDGFPRTIPQADALAEVLKNIGQSIDFAINIDVDRQTVLDRLTTRRTCSNSDCQAIYNVKSMPPKVEGKCDKCGSEIVQRADETVEVISKRLEAYNAQTAPLIDYYKAKGILVNVKADTSQEVVAQIREALKNK